VTSSQVAVGSRPAPLAGLGAGSGSGHEVGTLPNFQRIRRESGASSRIGRGGGDGDGVVDVRPDLALHQ
jgi:hypothetical protein